jgi:hypothetical protein
MNSPTSVSLTGQTTVFFTDQATLSGASASNFPGTINFTLNRPDGSFGAETVNVTSNGTYNIPFDVVLPHTPARAAGVWSWNASFLDASGSIFFAPTLEQMTVSAATPSLNTTASLVGSTLTDSATLSGGYFPIGNIRFSLFDPGGSPVGLADTVPVNGNGTYNSAAFTAALPGTYEWVVVFQPSIFDQNNGGAIAPFEFVTVGSSVPEPSTWAMMLLGFVGLGFAFRRSRRRVSFA